MGRFVVKNVNFFLVLLLLITVSFLVGVSVYYQNRFDNLSEDYITTLNRMQEAEKYQGLYLEAIQSLNTTSQSIQFYDKLYENKTVELEQTKESMTTQIRKLNEDLDDTEDDLKRTQNSLDNKIVLIDDLNDQINDLNEEYEVLEDSVGALEEEIDDLESDLDSCNSMKNAYKEQRNECADSHPGCYTD